MIVCDVLCSYCGRSIGLDSNLSAGFLDPTDVAARFSALIEERDLLLAELGRAKRP